MLLSRDYIGYMAAELAKRLVANNMIETATPVRPWPSGSA